MNEPFDRGDINEASLAATERLRARLMSQPVGPQPAPRSVLPWALAAALFAFAAGIIANPWFEEAVRGRLPFVPAQNAVVDPATAALAARLEALEARAPAASAEAPVEAAERLARTEARVDSSTGQIERDAQRIDSLTGQVSQLAARLAVEEAREANLITAIQGTADRAEAMLSVLLLRRAVEGGRPLDALLPVIRRLFEPRHGDAVAALAALSAAPVTRAGLASNLGGLAEQAQADNRPNWWQALMNRVQTVFSGENAGSSPVVQARAAVARGDLDAAVAVLRASPATSADPAVRDWLAAAQRLRAAEAALAELEGAALVTAPASPPLPAIAPTSAAAPPITLKDR